MRIVLLGVRGSTPAPGREFAGYGGHTSAVAVLGDAESRPTLVLDAGTGLRSLPALLAGAPFHGDVVLSHLHWDHLQGLPFCPSVDHPDARVRLHVPVAPGVDPEALLARALSPPHFPIDPSGLLGQWEFAALAGRRPALSDGAAGASVRVAPIEHKGGITYGIRVEQDGATLAYLPDHALAGDQRAGSDVAVDLVGGVDLLVHDGQYLADEDATAAAYGHATVDAALDFADRCAVGELLLTHHAPARTDTALDNLAAMITRTPGGIPVRFARQDGVVTVRPARDRGLVRP